MVTTMYLPTKRYQGQSNFQHYQKIANCLVLLYVTGEHRVWHRMGKQYNISFTVPSIIGPVIIDMIYDFTSLFQWSLPQPQHILLHIKHGYAFHPRLPISKEKYVIKLLGREIKVINPLAIHAIEIGGVNNGQACVIALKIRSYMFCSAGKAILT